MKLGQVLLVLYGAVLIAGGIIGYQKAGSTASLISGVTSGAVVLLSFALSLRTRPLAYLLGSGVAFALVCVFAYRLTKTAKFMPSGGMLIVSAVVLLLLLVARAQEARRERGNGEEN